MENDGPTVTKVSGLSKTLMVCALGLVAMGFVITGCLYPNPLAFVSYALLIPTIRSTRRIITRAAVLMLTLILVGAGFWFFWDAAFIHLSTMNFIPFELAVVESLVAGMSLVIVRKIERVNYHGGETKADDMGCGAAPR
jgi:hypothetical protein